MEKKEKRFIIKSATPVEFGSLLTMRVMVDTVTGVNYLVTSGDGVSGVTPSVIPLLDRDGKVVVDELPIQG